MFDVGFWEVALIFVVALLVVGPEKLPGLARTIGLYVGKARRYADHVRREIEREVRESDLKDIVTESKAIAEVKEAVKETGDVLRSQLNDDSGATSSGSSPTPDPVPAAGGSSATPKDAIASAPTDSKEP